MELKSKILQKDSLPTLFVSRMVVIYLVFIRELENVNPPFLSFISVLDTLEEFPFLFLFLSGILKISMVFILLGVRHNFFSLLLGGIIIWIILTNRVLFSNSLFYAGSILFLIGMYRQGFEWVFRVQIFLLYFGAGINKLLDGDWLTGQYFLNFFSNEFRNPFLVGFLNHFPGNSGFVLLSIFVIMLEIGLSLGVLLSKRRNLMVFSIFFFHLGMLILTFGDLSLTFFFLMASSSPLILDSFEKISIVNGNTSKHKFLYRIDYLAAESWNIFKKKLFPDQNQNILHGETLHYKIIYALLIFGVYMLFTLKNYFN